MTEVTTRSDRGRRMRLAAVVAALVVVVVLGIGQLALPGIAERRIRSEIGSDASGLEVSVRAFPAIRLVWGDADTIAIRIARLRASPGAGPGGLDAIADMLERTRGATRLDIDVGRLSTGSIELRDAILRRRDAIVRASATSPLLRPASAREMARGRGGPKVVLSGTVLSRRRSWPATISAGDGALVVSPDQPALRLVALRVLSDRRLEVASVRGQRSAAGYRVVVSGRLR